MVSRRAMSSLQTRNAPGASLDLSGALTSTRSVGQRRQWDSPLPRRMRVIRTFTPEPFASLVESISLLARTVSSSGEMTGPKSGHDAGPDPSHDPSQHGLVSRRDLAGARGDRGLRQRGCGTGGLGLHHAFADDAATDVDRGRGLGG